MRDRALPKNDKGNGAVESYDEQQEQRTVDEVLTARHSLHSIAVELNRANQLATAELQLKQQQTDLLRNGLDLVRAVGKSLDLMRAEGVATTDNASQLMDRVLGFAEPLLRDMMQPRPPKVSSTSKLPSGEGPAPVVHESGGTRIEHDAGE